MAKKAGKKTQEIAEFLGVSRKTVWKWTKKAHHPKVLEISQKDYHIQRKVTLW